MRQHVLVHVPALHLAHRFDFLAVLFRLVVLLAVLVEAVASLHLGRLRGLGLDRRFVELFNESFMRFFAVLSFRVTLRSWLALPSRTHR